MSLPIGVLADAAVFPWLAGIFGLAVGSFLNVVIHRLPRMMERDWLAQCAELQAEAAARAGTLPGTLHEEAVTTAGEPADPEDVHGAGNEQLNLLVPRSRCPACGHGIRAVENIPILSWLMLRGRCSACGTRISPRYPLIEIAAGVLAAGCALRFGATTGAVAAMLFMWALLAAGTIDIDTQLLPDDITLPLLWLGLLVNLAGTFTDLRSAVVGAAAGYLALWGVYWTFKLATGKEGMGYGDFKLLAAIGAWCGWQSLPLVILGSSVVGAIVGIGLIVLARHGREIPIPFGPYLAIAGAVALVWDRDAALSRQLLAAYI